jgi:hypothetical protein
LSSVAQPAASAIRRRVAPLPLGCDQSSYVDNAGSPLKSGT